MQLFAATVHGDCLTRASALCRRAGRTPRPPTHGRDLVNARHHRGRRARCPAQSPSHPAVACHGILGVAPLLTTRSDAGCGSCKGTQTSVCGWVGAVENHGRLPRRRLAQPPRSCAPSAVTMSCCRRQRWRRWRHAGIPPVVSRRCLRAGAWLSPTVGKFASNFAKGLNFGPNVQPKPRRGRGFAPHRPHAAHCCARVDGGGSPPPTSRRRGAGGPTAAALDVAQEQPRLRLPLPAALPTAPRSPRRRTPAARRPSARPPAPTLAARSAAAGRVRASLPRPAWRAAVEWLARASPQIAAAAPPAGWRARWGRRGRRPSTGRLEPAADPRAFMAVSPASRSRCSTT